MSSSLLLGLAALQGVHAWGTLGHETVAYIASHYVKSDTKTWAQNILGDTSTSYLANVATWADTYRYTDAGSWSAPFHFIDANDDPPNSCNVNYDRDCVGTGCVVSAIANYTQRVQETDSLSDDEVETALKFIVHFLGDITQPLHDEAYEYGANDVYVTFDGSSTNLHHIWDTNMPEEYRGGYSLSDAQSWANDIVKSISSGDYKSQASSWVSGMSISDIQTTAMGWATDANAYVCSTVMPNGADTLENGDLYPDYYNGVIDTLELQIAKGGYRLAKWLDLIAANQSADKKRSVVKRNVDLTGQDLLPPPRELTQQQRRRMAVGCSCHDH